MSRYDGLIRLRKWELDEQRRMLRLLEDDRDKLIDRLEALDAEVAQSAAYSGSDLGSWSLAAYLEAARLKKQDLTVQIDQQEKDIERQQDKISGAFQDLKTIEIAAEKLKETEALEKSRQEQLIMDETGLQLHIRRGKLGRL